MVKILLIFLTAILCLEYASLPVYAATRVALVSTCDENEEGGVLALAEAQLGAQADIALLERREVERVLDEQKLMRMGLADSKQAIATGKLLGVEVFAVLEILPGSKEVLGLIVFDAGNGLKLLDMTLPADEMEKTAKIVVNGVNNACAKRQKPALQRKTVCLLTVRNAELPREMDGFCTALGILLERALLNSPGIALLERNRLELFNRERSLPVAGELKDLWSSVVVAELDVRRAADGRDLRVVCHLSNVTGQDIDTVEATASQTNADSLSRELAARFTESLQVVPISAEAKPIVEANRFYREAQFLRSHDVAAAVDKMSVACALAPTNTNSEFHATLNSFIVDDAYGRLRHAIIYYGLTEKRQVFTKAMDIIDPVLVERQIDNHRWVRNDTNTYELPNPHNLGYPRNAFLGDPTNHFLVLLCNNYKHGDAAQQTRMRKYIDEFLDNIVECIENGMLRAGGVTDDSYLIHNNTCAGLGYIQCVKVWSISPGDYHRRLCKIATTWLKMSGLLRDGKMPAHTWNSDPYANQMAEMWYLECTNVNFGLTTEDVKITEAMIRHPSPVVQLYGQAITLQHAGQIGCLPMNVANQKRKEFKELALNVLAENPNWEWCGKINLLFNNIISNANELHQVHLTMFNIMLSHRLIWDDLVVSLINGEPDQASKLKLIDRILAVNALEDSRCSGRRGRGTLAAELEQFRNQINIVPFSLLVAPKNQLHNWPAPPPECVPVSNLPPQEITNLPLTNSHRVFDITSVAGLNSFGFPLLDGESIYMVGNMGKKYENPGLSKLVKIHLPDGAVQQILDIKGMSLVKAVKAVCLGKGHYYVATDKTGIYDISLETGEVRIINQNNGLPSLAVHSIAYLDGYLYLGLGDDGYIVSYDLENSRTRVLASSRRLEKLSPFDNGPPFQTDHMLADPPRKRVIFHVSGQKDIWQIKQDNTICLYNKIIQRKATQNNPFLNHDIDSGCSVYIQNNGTCIRNYGSLTFIYDLLHDQCEMVDATWGFPYYACHLRVHCFNGKWLWISNPPAELFGRINMENLKGEMVRYLVEGEVAHCKFNPEYIFPFNEGKQLLFSDGQTLWLVDLRI